MHKSISERWIMLQAWGSVYPAEKDALVKLRKEERAAGTKAEEIRNYIYAGAVQPNSARRTMLQVWRGKLLQCRSEGCRNHAHKGSFCINRLCSREGCTNQTHSKGPSIEVERKKICPTNRISMALSLSTAEKKGHYLTTVSLSFDCIVH
eukprot:scaffold2088_cov86-Skeletonema_dohrnii-CCMP3373.AAC.2